MADECGDLTQFQATVNILKSMIGLGLLNLPLAAKEIGWLPACVGTPALAWLSAKGVLYAVEANKRLNSIDQKDGPTETTGLIQDLEDSVTTLTLSSRFETGLGSFDGVVRVLFGLPGQALCTFCILVCQSGTAIAYVAVIIPSILDISGRTVSDEEGSSPSWTLLLGLWLALSVVSLLRSLREVAVISFIGLLTYLLVFAALVVESVHRMGEGTFAQHFEMIRWDGPGPGWGNWFGISVFAFGAFPIAVAVNDDLEEGTDIYSAVRWSFGIAGLFCTVFALVGYACYGDETKRVIHFNFPEDSLLRKVSLIALVVVLVFTYVLQMNPVFKFSEGYLRQYIHIYYIRTIIVALTIAIAVVLPHVVMAIQVAESLSTATIGLIMPPVVYLAACRFAHHQAHILEYPLAVAVVGIGILGCWRSLI